MAKQMRRTIAAAALVGLLVVGWMGAAYAGQPAWAVERPAQQATLPTIVFLGKGPGTFTVQPPLHFLVKAANDNVYRSEDGPTYTTDIAERIWSVDHDLEGGLILYHALGSFGQVDAGCLVQYVQVDDDVDNRINHFYLDGVEVHEVPQGMVTYGSFTIEQSGELTFYAEDSVGLVIVPCAQASPTPTDTALPTATFTPTETTSPTDTPLPTETSTNTPVPTETPTNTPEPTSAPTSTSTPESTGTLSPTTAPTTTSTPELTTTLSPTSTAVATHTPTPTNTAVPTSTPVPTNTPVPTHTPIPTNTPEPTSTPKPTNTPRPANTPTPTNTPKADSQANTPTPTSTPAPVVTVTPSELLPVTGRGPGAASAVIAAGASLLGMGLLLKARQRSLRKR